MTERTRSTKQTEAPACLEIMLQLIEHMFVFKAGNEENHFLLGQRGGGDSPALTPPHPTNPTQLHYSVFGANRGVCVCVCSH